MADLRTILVFSDVHYASSVETARGCPEFEVIGNPLLRGCIRAYRHYIWRRNPFAHNHLVDRFLETVGQADYVVGNGDYSCDSAFVGVCDDAAFQSASECLSKIRDRCAFGLRLTIGDHELGKMSLVGRRGGIRLASWHRTLHDLCLEPFWTERVGAYLLLGVTSSLIAFPVFEPESLDSERQEWNRLREQHLALIRDTFAHLEPGQRLILFCHDPTALPFLWRDDAVRSKLSHIELTVIGHLHSELFLWNSRALSGMPVITICGNSIRRMSTALREGRLWKHFRVRLCPSLGGIELLKDGGYCRLVVDPSGREPLHFERKYFPKSFVAAK